MRPGNMALVFTVRNTLLGSIASSADESERIFSLQLHSSVVLVSLITAYAPILSSPGEAKDLTWFSPDTSYRSAECDTNPSLVCSRAKLPSKQLYHTKKEGRPRFDMSKSRQRGKVEEFACALDESFPGAHNGNACDWWENFNNAAFSIFSRETNKTADWFDSHTEEMTLASEEKRGALAA